MYSLQRKVNSFRSNRQEISSDMPMDSRSQKIPFLLTDQVCTIIMLLIISEFEFKGNLARVNKSPILLTGTITDGQRLKCMRGITCYLL